MRPGDRSLDGLAGVQDGHVRLYRSWVAGITTALGRISPGTHTIVPSDCLFAQCEKKLRPGRHSTKLRCLVLLEHKSVLIARLSPTTFPCTLSSHLSDHRSSLHSQKDKTCCHHQRSQRQAGCPNGPKEKDTSRQTPGWSAGSSDGFGEYSYQPDWPSHQGAQGIHPAADHCSN